jgi:squalene-hopene/tetraprenyl-beta-curcumene cyclase
LADERHGDLNQVDDERGSPDVQAAIDAAQAYLLGKQDPSGCWSSELIGDSTLESDAVMLMHFLRDVDPDRQEGLLRHVLSQQNADGGWSIYRGGPSDPNATLKAYFALRLSGRPDSDPAVGRARERLLRLGGIEACNSYSKFYLAMFGLYDWNRLPSMIPELMLLPASPVLVNLYRISAWTRTIVVPMLLLFALRPRVPVSFNLRDLQIPHPPAGARSFRQGFWRAVFKFADRVMALYNRRPSDLLRRVAMRKAERWVVERARTPGGLGAIYPPMLNTVMAFHALGYGKDHPDFAKALRDFRELEIHERGLIRVQPCFSAVWDTAWAVHALARGGTSDASAVRRGADWLYGKQVFETGDWKVNCRTGKPGGWAFEHDNPFYPDTDDTSAVLMGLHFAGRSREPGFAAGVRWLRNMQNPDGGWGAFDRNVNLEVLEHLPWADHNALLDPSTADLTGRILETFGYLGHRRDEAFMARAIQYLRRAQEPDGSWFGRWGVNYIYGTWQVLVGLSAAGVDPSDPSIRSGAGWLRSVQNPDGGWGETCSSYDDPSRKGRGRSTPSQTSWGLLGLLAAGADPSEPAVERAVRWLLARQRLDGAWEEHEHTGTGFPRVFYLVYTMYREYFPLLALQAVRDARRRAEPQSDPFTAAIPTGGLD